MHRGCLSAWMWIHNPTTNNSSGLAWGGWYHDPEAIRNWFCTPLVWLKDVESGGVNQWIHGNPLAERCIDELQIWDPERFEAWRVWFSLSILTPKSSARSLRHYRAALEMLGTCDSYRRSIGLHRFCWFTVCLQMDRTCSSCSWSIKDALRAGTFYRTPIGSQENAVILDMQGTCCAWFCEVDLGWSKLLTNNCDSFLTRVC